MATKSLTALNAWAACALLAPSLPSLALDRSGLLLYASLDGEADADFARGDREALRGYRAKSTDGVRGAGAIVGAESGQIKTQVIAGQAIVSEDGNIDATDVRIEMFTEEGEMEALVLAEACHLDRENEFVTSDARVDFERGDVHISGVGFEWHAKDESFKILDQARVEFPRDSLGMKVLGP